MKTDKEREREIIQLLIKRGNILEHIAKHFNRPLKEIQKIGEGSLNEGNQVTKEQRDRTMSTFLKD